MAGDFDFIFKNAPPAGVGVYSPYIGGTATYNTEAKVSKLFDEKMMKQLVDLLAKDFVINPVNMPTVKDASAVGAPLGIGKPYKTTPSGECNCEFCQKLGKEEEKEKEMDTDVPEPVTIFANEEKRTVVVLWDDGDTSKVTCGEHDTFSAEAGFFAAFTQKMYGGKPAYKQAFNNMIEKRIVYQGADHFAENLAREDRELRLDAIREKAYSKKQRAFEAEKEAAKKKFGLEDGAPF